MPAGSCASLIQRYLLSYCESILFSSGRLQFVTRALVILQLTSSSHLILSLCHTLQHLSPSPSSPLPTSPTQVFPLDRAGEAAAVRPVTDMLLLAVYEICMGIIVRLGQSLTTEDNLHHTNEPLPLTSRPLCEYRHKNIVQFHADEVDMYLRIMNLKKQDCFCVSFCGHSFQWYFVHTIKLQHERAQSGGSDN